MAQPDIIKGTYFSLMLGDGADPEVFTALCGFNTRTFRAQANTNDQFTRDCADPEDVPIRRLIVSGKAWSLTGEGTLNRSNLAVIQAAWAERILFTEPADDEVYQGYYYGPGVMVTYEITGGDENYATLSINIESDGVWDWQTVTP
jgi:hypothetical protein